MSIIKEENLAKVVPVIETYVNGLSWYRIYADGWCEQGGRLGGTVDSFRTINLLKTYRDTNYTISLAESNPNDNNNSRNSTISYDSMTGNTIRLYANRYPYWETRGYLAEGQY